MKGGKRRRTADSLQFPHPPLLPVIDIDTEFATAEDAVNDASEGLEDERRTSKEESEKFTAAGPFAEEGGGVDSEGEKEDEHQLENSQIEVKETEGERPKLADGYYEIEAIRRKRVRKGQVQYLIKWRDWSEEANTWEPVKNLLQCSDVIEAFEESLKAGKSRLTHKRKRKTNITHILTNKKQCQSPVTATNNVTLHMVQIVEEPIPFPNLNGMSCTKNGGGTDISSVNAIKIPTKVNENGVRIAYVNNNEGKEQNELDLKLSDLKETTVIGIEDADRQAFISTQEGQLTRVDTYANGLTKADGIEPVQSGRCTGAKKRKSASVKRFKQDPVACSADDAQNAVVACAAVQPRDVQHPDFLGNHINFKNKYDSSKSLCTITQLVKPISYKASISNNVQEVLVAFEAVRSDGTKVTVDNKFLKANNPLLLIDFYEKHLRYSPS